MEKRFWINGGRILDTWRRIWDIQKKYNLGHFENVFGTFEERIWDIQSKYLGHRKKEFETFVNRNRDIIMKEG